jgi:hypothetical protein
VEIQEEHEKFLETPQRPLETHASNAMLDRLLDGGETEQTRLMSRV